jgi:tripartite-type tricarboxylate transporter receptor subunit TctC
MGVGQEGSFLSINPGPGNLSIQPDFAQHDGQASTLGGDVQMFSANSPKFLNGAGKLRALAVTIERRLDAFPDIPAVAEFVPGYEASNWYGVGAPRNTEIVEKLNKEINAGLADPKLRARLADLGGTVLAGLPSDFAKLIADETEKWGKVIRALNIKAD